MKDKTEQIPVDEDRVITLTDEDGKELECYHSATIEHEGKSYAFLQPMEETDDLDDDCVIVFEISEDENDPEIFNLLPVEDEALQDTLFELYDKMAEEFEGEECGCGCGCGDECDCDDECDCGCDEHKHSAEKCDCNKK